MFKIMDISDLLMDAENQEKPIISRHIRNYTNLCEYISIAKMTDRTGTLLSCRKIAKTIGASKTCVNDLIRDLEYHGWVRRVETSNSPKGVKYRIMISLSDAQNFLKFCSLITFPKQRKKYRKNDTYRTMDALCGQ